MHRIKALTLWLLTVVTGPALAGTQTWDGKHDTSKIDVTIVYFVPSDRTPLVDWRDRVAYYQKRIELFHRREFGDQSTLSTRVFPEPVISSLDTNQLRRGDGDAIFFRTLNETDRRIEFAKERKEAFPILLVLSDINWRPLDDFYRLRPDGNRLVFEGINDGGQHFPGASSGGARATYLADRGVGWGLVSADGWRVPYRGSDCVIYHEGCGHTVGLPHPDEPNASVMSLGQYRGWISESWIDKDQKSRLNWTPEEPTSSPQIDLFTAFRAIPDPFVPRPGDDVRLKLDWPEGANVESLRTRFQTSLDGPWIDVPQTWDGDSPTSARLGSFDRATPISYRLDAHLKDGSTAELWGYLQVRDRDDQPPQPLSRSSDLIAPHDAGITPATDQETNRREVDLLTMIDPRRQWSQGEWSLDAQTLNSPKAYGSRIEIPYSPPEEYRLILVVQPLDEPNGFLIGNRSGNHRFVTLFHFATPGGPKSAIENIDGRNVGNETTYDGELFKKDRVSQLIVMVRKDSVTMQVDGRVIVHWRGKPEQLSLSEYWQTPDDTALFLGAYDCRYRIHRFTLEPISGDGKRLQ